MSYAQAVPVTFQQPIKIIAIVLTVAGSESWKTLRAVAFMGAMWSSGAT